MIVSSTLALFLATSAPAAESVKIEAVPIALNPALPGQTSVDDLLWRGGVALQSANKRFGGLSDLVVSPDGRALTAVSDEGAFLTAGITYDSGGLLSGLKDAVLHPMRDAEGRALEGKERQDAEALAELEDGSLVVGFEHWHRLWRYPEPDASAEPVAQPADLEHAPENGGVETLVRLVGDDLLALTEDKEKDGILEGWLRRGGRWEAIGYRPFGPLRPSGGCELPSGDLLVLERNFEKKTGVTARLRRIPAAAVRPGAVLEGEGVATLTSPLSVDNFEGLACRPGARGETLLYLVSDDNFSSSQRTLLLMFALKDGS